MISKCIKHNTCRILGQVGCLVVFIHFIIGCTSLDKPSSGDTYHESSMNDLNRAPQRFSPPTHENELSDTAKYPANSHAKADYYFTMGETYSLEGDSRKAIESYKNVLVYDPNSATVYLKLAIESVKSGLVSEAINYCESAIKIDGKRVDVHLLLAGLYSSIKAYDGAVKEYETVISIDPNNDEAPLYLGAVYAEKKQYSKALGYFSKLASDEEYSNRYLVEYYSGRVYQEMKKNAEAEAAYKRSLLRKADFYDSAIALGILYEAQGKKDQAIDLYIKFQRENGPHATLAGSLSQIFLGKQEYDKALEQLLILEEFGEDIITVKVKIALIYVEQKKYEKAIVKFEETLNLAPESDKVRFYLAALYEEMKNNDKALKYFQEVPSDSNFYSESVVHAASILRKQDRLTAAKDVLDKALAVKPESPQMFILYAAIMDSLGLYEEGLKKVSQGMERFPNQPNILFYYGTLNDKLGKKEEMVSVMKKIIEMDPKHTQAINYLAYTYAETASNLPMAESLARKAHQLSPEDPFIMDTLGWVLYKQGRVKEAIPWLEAALTTQPNESVIAEHLGDAYSQHQLPEKAREMYQRALQSESDKEKLKKIEEKITSIESSMRGQRLPAALLEPIPN